MRVPSISARLALASTRDKRQRSPRPTLLVIAATVVAAAFGAVGWWMAARRDASLTLDGPAIAYRTISLFAAEVSDPPSAPWPLAAARLLAPLCTASAGLLILLSAAEFRLHRLAARRARDHVLLIGPQDRIAPYTDTALGIIVQADFFDSQAVPGIVRTRIDWPSEGWLKQVNATQARRIVIATADDAINLAILGTIIREVDLLSRTDVRVELDDRNAALWLAATLGTDRPELNIDVVCKDDVIAHRAAEQVLNDVSDRTDAVPPIVALVGDGAVIRYLARHLVEGLLIRNVALTDLPNVVIAEHPEGTQLANDLRHWAAPVEAVDSRQGLGDLPMPPRVVVVVYRSPEESGRTAVELRGRYRKAHIYLVASTGAVPPGLRALDLTGEPGADVMEGPWAQVARRRHDELKRNVKLTDWDALDLEARKRAIASVRRMVAELERNGYQVMPSSVTDIPSRLPIVVAERLRSVDQMMLDSTLKEHDAVEDLPKWLARVGLTVLPDPATVLL